MRAYGQAMRATARRHLGTLEPGRSFAMHDVTRQISFDIILQTIFGIDESHMDATRPTVARSIDALSPALLFTDKLQASWFPPFRRFATAREEVRRAMFSIMATRREGLSSGQPHDDILSMLLESRYDDGSSMSDEEILDQLFSLLFAGHETTAIAIAWSVYWLLEDRTRLAKLRDELAHLGPEPTLEAVTKLPYLGAVCTESLRLNPILPDPIRSLRKSLTLGPYTIPAGYGVGVAACTIHQDPASYPRPEAFEPERWLGVTPSPFSYLPFGGGHRRCIGQAFSDYEQRVVLAEIVSALELHLEGPERAVRRNIVMGPEHGVRVRVVSRRPANESLRHASSSE
jgi:cytochrome P450